MKHPFELRALPGPAGPPEELQLHEMAEYRFKHEQKDLFLAEEADERQSRVVSRLKGAALDMARDDLRLWLKEAGLPPSALLRRDFQPQALEEELGVRLALFFGAVGPLKKRERVQEIFHGLSRMPREEVLYWYGKAREVGRERAFHALRVLLSQE